MPGTAGVAPAGRTSSSTSPTWGGSSTALWQEGYTVVGPTIAQGAIVFDEVRGLDQLPIGWTDEQEGGTYRLKRRDDGAYFGYAVGPHSWKKYLFPSRLTLFSIERPAIIRSTSIPVRSRFPAIRVPGRPLVRLARDRDSGSSFPGGPLRRPALSGPSGTGLHHRGELRPGGGHLLLHEHEDRPEGGSRVRPGADRAAGCVLASRWPPTAAARSWRTSRAARPTGAGAELRRRRVVRDTESQIKRRLDTSDLPELLYNNLEHPRWDDVAGRCLSCTNCTMVCPTCFCHSIEDVPDLDEPAQRASSRLGLVLQPRACPHGRREHAARDPLALPPMADAQAGLVDRSVSASPAAWAAGAASPGVPWRSTSPRKWPRFAAGRPA